MCSSVSCLQARALISYRRVYIRSDFIFRSTNNTSFPTLRGQGRVIRSELQHNSGDCPPDPERPRGHLAVCLSLGCDSPTLASSEPTGPIESRDGSMAEQGWLCEQVALRQGEEGKQEPETSQQMETLLLRV